MKITPEHIGLFRLAEQKKSTDSLYTKVLLLKSECKTHKEIATILGISPSYVNHILTAVRKQSRLTD